jgi:hypothetical protein
MTSFKQLQANRRNAPKSAGPRSEQANSVPAEMLFGMD